MSSAYPKVRHNKNFRDRFQEIKRGNQSLLDISESSDVWRCLSTSSRKKDSIDRNDGKISGKKSSSFLTNMQYRKKKTISHPNRPASNQIPTPFSLPTDDNVSFLHIGATNKYCFTDQTTEKKNIFIPI